MWSGVNDTSYEPEQSLVDKNIYTIDDDETDMQEPSDAASPRYAVEEVFLKAFNSEGNDYENTTFEYQGGRNGDNIIIEEQSKNPGSEITKSTTEKKPAAKRKRKYSHVVKDKPHECQICNKRFNTTPQLSRHINSHTGNRPYKCKYCEDSFGDPSTKIKHERIHTNERPYECLLCNKTFGYSNVLKIHMMTHTGEKPHNCKICGKAFSHLHHKNSHEKRHNKSK